MTLIVVEPTYAEYRDRIGLHRLQFLWKAGTALVRGELPAKAPLEDHAKVRPD